MDNRYTITINGQAVNLGQENFYKIFSQMQKIADRDDIKNTLDCTDTPYTEKSLDYIVDNLRNNLWYDDDFSHLYDDIVIETSDDYWSGIREALADPNSGSNRDELLAELEAIGE